MSSQSTVQQHTTTAPRAMPARWGTQQFMHSHARFVDSPRNQTTQPEHRFLHRLSAHESASMEIIGEVYQYNSSDCLIIKHVNFFFASHNNLCATHWTQTITWFIYAQQRSWGLLSITLHVSVHSDHTLTIALRYESSLYTQTMWTIQLVFWKANLWTHTSLYHECVCRQIIQLLLWQHFRRAHFSHAEEKKEQKNLHAGTGDTLSNRFQTNYTNAHVIIQANEEREAIFSGVCVVRCTHGWMSRCSTHSLKTLIKSVSAYSHTYST